MFSSFTSSNWPKIKPLSSTTYIALSVSISSTYGIGNASGPTDTIIVTRESGFITVFDGGWVRITEPAGTDESAEFSIPTLNPRFWRSSNACACSLPVRSGISIKAGAPPSTGSPSKTCVNVHTVPITTPIDTIRAGNVNLNLTFGLVRSTKFSLVCSDWSAFLCWSKVALKSSADLNLS